MNKKSFVLYFDKMKLLQKLSDQDIGKVMRGILTFLDTKEIPNIGVEQLFFESICEQLVEDERKYQKVLDVKRENGKKGGRPPLKSKKNHSVIKSPVSLPKAQKTHSREDKDKDIKNLLKDHPFIDRELFFDFLDVRKKKKNENSIRSIKILLKRLSEFEGVAIGNANKSIENSIVGGYMGVFEPKATARVKESIFDTWGEEDLKEVEVKEVSYVG